MSLSSERASVSASSESSSTVWGHESFVHFQPKASAFARSIVWPHSNPKDEITVERLRGGGYNRIIGLTLIPSAGALPDEGAPDGGAPDSQDVKTPSSEATIRYILRIPRAQYTKVDDDVAALLFVHQLLNGSPEMPKIPVPKVILFDWTSDNCLESHFMVQTRLRGRPLLDVYPELSHEQKRRVARELGQVFRRMFAVSSTQAGKLVLPDDDRTLDAELHVAAWEDPEDGLYLPEGPRTVRKSTPYRSGPATESILDVLKPIFQEGRDKSVPQDGYVADRFGQFCNMVTEMDAAGYFKKLDRHFTLSHLDLEPRNILAVPASDTDSPIITGILDWDSAILGPAFMTCSPPMWIWHWTGDEEGDERMANDEPSSHEQRELKAEYEASAGMEYMQYAYHPAYSIARRIVRYAIYYEHDAEDMAKIDILLEEWEHFIRWRQIFRDNAATRAVTPDVEVLPVPTDCTVVSRDATGTSIHDPGLALTASELSQAEDQCPPVVDIAFPEVTSEGTGTGFAGSAILSHEATETIVHDLDFEDASPEPSRAEDQCSSGVDAASPELTSEGLATEGPETSVHGVSLDDASNEPSQDEGHCSSTLGATSPIMTPEELGTDNPSKTQALSELEPVERKA